MVTCSCRLDVQPVLHVVDLLVALELLHDIAWGTAEGAEPQAVASAAGGVASVRRWADDACRARSIK